ncbi:hypothetical protein VitviT2T_002675 [Vitis vinifera]|uniref:Uncharacterized protein n=1 Tax=Vitis vinifera TaxID=29760 RepID=A0ABY9BJU1_VITVI|nr:hypothetical protein VitviT2T_002675 [Vitis vinifera]
MMTALNVKLRINDGSERQTENAILNVKLRTMALNARNSEGMMILNVELRTNDNSERQTEDATLNVKL